MVQLARNKLRASFLSGIDCRFLCTLVFVLVFAK